MWNWFSRLAPKHRMHRARRRYVRPLLEALEARYCPSGGSLDWSDPPGWLDPTFGVAGAGAVPQGASNVLIQSNGQVLVFSNSGSVTRYNTNGSLDTSFGSGGTAQANFGTGNTLIVGGVQGEALQPSDGKILMSGVVKTSSGGYAFALARLNSNGSADTSFGNQGEVTTSISSNIVLNGGYGESIVVQSNGEIVFGGSYVNGVRSGNTYQYHTYIDLARYNTDGSLDTSFGNNGVVATPLSQYSSIHTDALLLQPNGELIVVADTYQSASQQWVLARYTTNGSLDTSFGSQGIATTPSASNQLGNTVVDGAVLYPSTDTANGGKIAVVGYNTALSSGPLLARFNTNGSLDTAFGSGGFVPVGVTGGVVFDSSERFVIGGTANGNTNNSSMALERLNADGTPDTTFGNSGALSAGMPGSQGPLSFYDSTSGAPAIYPSTGTDTADAGKIVLGGSSFVARFLPSAAPISSNFVVTGSGSTTAGALYTITVTATDANGNTLTNYAGTVDFGSFDPQAVLLQPYTFTAADQGVHAFTVVLKTAGQQALFVADTANPYMNGHEVGIQVNPAALARFIFVDSPTSVKSATSFSLYADAVDAYGNLVTFNGTIGFSSSDPKATLPGPESYPGNGRILGSFILRTKGTQTITIFDESDPSISGTVSINVT